MERIREAKTKRGETEIETLTKPKDNLNNKGETKENKGKSMKSRKKTDWRK